MLEKSGIIDEADTTGKSEVAARKRNSLTEAQRLHREQAYLRHILVYVDSGETSSSFFRTLVDNWYGYHRGGAFLKSTGTPHWFNSVKPKDHSALGPALREMDFISVEADRILAAGTGGVLVKDHAIPVALLRDMILDEKPITETAVREFLLDWYRVGVITEDEHEELKIAKCRGCMPSGWDRRARFARYVHARLPRAGGRCAIDDVGTRHVAAY